MIKKIKLLIASQTEFHGPGQITVRQSDQSNSMLLFSTSGIIFIQGAFVKSSCTEMYRNWVLYNKSCRLADA